jgi:proliferating cell nuclear antigen
VRAVSSAIEADDRADELSATNDEDAVVSILTYGDPLRSFTKLPAALVDEARVRFDADGVHINAIDPAHVAMVDVTAHASGFSRYELDAETVVGLNLDTFQSAAQWARKRGDDGDPVAIDVLEDPARVRVRVTRPDQQMTRVTEWFAIDPDAIREEPDIPDLELHQRATPSVRALHESTKAVKDSTDHAVVTRDDATFVVGTNDDGDVDLDASPEDVTDSVMVPNCAWDTRDTEDAEPQSSRFSLDYFDDITTALKTSKADRVTVEWGDEFPTVLRFEHENWGFEGEYLIAPRIQSDGERP